jgi:AmmeMemoRadiSam system protein B
MVMSKRVAGVRGAFYPKNCLEIGSMIKTWNRVLDEKLADKNILKEIPRAIIAPHAGYIYSGFTANFAHRLLANSKAKRVLVFGPSHHVYIDGMSASEQDIYETPCGDIEIDKEYLQTIKKQFPLNFVEKAHRVEHSTETQMPFIKHYLPKAKVIEFIYGKADYKKIAKLIHYLLKDRDNVIVISTDLSHFYTQESAKKLDNICLHAISQKEVSMLDKGCEACGMIGVKAMLEVSKVSNLAVEILDYRTSADVSKDESSVVGYVSAYIM